jgi:hypothetical protein
VSGDVALSRRAAKAALVALRLQQFDLARYGRLSECDTVAKAADEVEAALAGQVAPR